jgi:hypothetical protein
MAQPANAYSMSRTGGDGNPTQAKHAEKEEREDRVHEEMHVEALEARDVLERLLLVFGLAVVSLSSCPPLRWFATSVSNTAARLSKSRDCSADHARRVARCERSSPAKRARSSWSNRAAVSVFRTMIDIATMLAERRQLGGAAASRHVSGLTGTRLSATTRPPALRGRCRAYPSS